MTLLSQLTKLLETIDSALEEVEQQLIHEFDRIRNTLSDSRFEPIDRGVKVALWDVVEELRHMLENSGDKVNFELQTRKHEIVFARLIVLRQLLNSRIPTAFLHEAHNELEIARKKLEKEEADQRDKSSVTAAIDEARNKKESHGFFDFFKKMFSTRHSKKAKSSRAFTITTEERKRFEPMQIYLDNGIYSASRELSIISVRMIDAQESGELDKLLAEEDEEAKMRLASGKARFRSRELSGEALEAIEKKEREMARSYGKAQFESRELSRKRLEALNKKATRDDIAQSPEEIRKKLASRDRTASGKASFSSKDIKHEMPAAPLVESKDRPKPRPKSKR